MKHIYGFKAENPGDWGDIFDNEDTSPEVKISSACHKYYDLSGNLYIGFDLSLKIEIGRMNELLNKFCETPTVFKVL